MDHATEKKTIGAHGELIKITLATAQLDGHPLAEHPISSADPPA
jgi:hypothetical protein